MVRDVARLAKAASLVLSLAAVPLGADAQSSVTLYGILDTGIAQVQHSLNFDPNHPVEVIPYANAPGNHSATGMFNGGLSASRWGMRGTEDLGSGLRAIFTLESAMNVPTGNVSNAAASLANNKSTGPNMSADSAVSGQLFARGAFVGLEQQGLGSLTFGRHQSFFLENIAEFDPMLGSQIFSPIGFSGTYGGGGNTEDSRVDDSVRYKNQISDFRIGGLYKFGGIAGKSTAQSGFQLNAIYDHGPLGFDVGYQSFKDAFASANGATVGTLAVTANNTAALMAAARFRLGAVTARVGYEREELKNPSNPAQDTITSLFGYPISGTVNVNPYAIKKTLNVYWGGVNWEATSAFTLSAAYYSVVQNDYTGTACAVASAKCGGDSRFYSLLADFRFSKRTDTYAGFMRNGVTGGLGFHYLFENNHIIGIGLRHRF